MIYPNALGLEKVLRYFLLISVLIIGTMDLYGTEANKKLKNFVEVKHALTIRRKLH